MSNDTPTPDTDAPASTTKPRQPLAAELLTASALPATTAGPVALEPKLPPFRGD